MLLSAREPLITTPSIDLSLISIRHPCSEDDCLHVLSFSPFLLNHGLMLDNMRAYARAQHKPGTGHIQDLIVFLDWCSWLFTQDQPV